MHSDKKRCADTLSLSRQAEQNRAEERVSIDTKKGSKYNKSNEKRGGGIQLKKRKWKFRIAGGAVTLLGIYLMAVGYGETITLTIATVVLIFGIAIWSMATPENYNSMTDFRAFGKDLRTSRNCIELTSGRILFVKLRNEWIFEGAYINKEALLNLIRAIPTNPNTISLRVDIICKIEGAFSVNLSEEDITKALKKEAQKHNVEK